MPTAPPGVPLTDEHRAYLIAQGLPAAWIAGDGSALLRSATEPEHLPEGLRWVPDPVGILFGWNAVSETVWQFRADKPPVDSDTGRPMKYLFAKGAGAPFGVLKAPADGSKPARSLIVEGTKQGHAAAAVAPADTQVLAIAGCRSWSVKGVLPAEMLPLVRGTATVVCLDADASTNRNVYDAGVALAEQLGDVANTVRFMSIPGGGKSGLDDYLTTLPEGERADELERLLDAANGNRKPARKAPRHQPKGGTDAPEDLYDPASGSLNVEIAAEYLLTQHPMALALDGALTVYRNGVYRRDPEVLNIIAGKLLGDRYSKTSVANIEGRLRGLLAERELRLPESPTVPWLNLRNGMLDLSTLELHPHDPAYMSATQLPVEWHPLATCPTYVRWLTDCAGAEQIPGLEEVSSQFLDPGRAPTKAPFLYGASRSGKGTFLRIMRAMAGDENVSGVTLHQLARDQFSAANVYGKVLNIGGDLSAEHVRDLAAFKMLTGEDPVLANPKYGKQFTFVNRAQFAFSANNPPTVSERSDAYVNRMGPAKFGNTFAGREDPAVERAIMAELAGILVRWVHARRAHIARGCWLPVPAAVRDEFAGLSDKVARFVAECCRTGVTSASGTPVNRTGEYLPGPATLTDLYKAFGEWDEEAGGRGMGRLVFREKLESQPGVREMRVGASRSRGYNVEIRPKDTWGETFDNAASDDDGTDGTGGTPVPNGTPPPVVPPAPASAPVSAPTLVQSAPAVGGHQPPPAPSLSGGIVGAHPALRRLTHPLVERLLQVGAPCDPHVTVDQIDPLAPSAHWWDNAPAAITLTEVATLLAMPPERARAYLRVTHAVLAYHGVVLLERRLVTPGALSRTAPLTGDFVSKPDKAALKRDADAAKKAATAAAAAHRKLSQRKAADPVEVAAAKAALDQAESEAETARLAHATATHLPPELTAYAVLILPAHLPQTLTGAFA